MTLPVTTVSLQNKAQVSLVQKAVNKEDTDHLNVIFGESHWWPYDVTSYILLQRSES